MHHNLVDLELGVIGSALARPEFVEHQGCAGITPELFTNSKLAYIWELLANGITDVPEIAHALERKGHGFASNNMLELSQI